MRPTADIDILESGGTDLRTIAKLAGRNSPLHNRHGVYIDVVTVADVPGNYDERLTTAFDAAFEKLRFRIFERHDWFWPRSCGIMTETALISWRLLEDLDSTSTCFARATSRSSGQSWADRNARTLPSSSGSKSSRKPGSGRVEIRWRGYH
jgi:hypothetical protein